MSAYCQPTPRILSGTFFPYSHFPDAMIPFVKALPLAALNDALRAVMIDGAGGSVPLAGTLRFQIAHAVRPYWGRRLREKCLLNR